MPLLSSSKAMGYSPTKNSSSRQTPSFSSSPSFSLCSFSEFPVDSSLGPATPPRLTGVPFSWEHLPGIPKKPSHKRKDSKLFKILPLPPPTSKRFNMKEVKKNSNGCFGKDPFFTAFIECSKVDDNGEEASGSNFWNGSKVLRSISGRFGFINLHTSCKRTCAVSESIVRISRSRRHQMII
ncbi:uncharacterized protein LOC110609754 [Manihot esculenta]|uniref:Uncharacterized protein n=1 Tax=Manihot esculenta TaxID=3983 RepID=A0A2C9WGU1_MANES|nr:uncharacterized protein LOC110609754 [Manihot esculenta]OAY58610.1 hypothetical protein MANES_02G192500v8 [Manihot esculenta]